MSSGDEEIAEEIPEYNEDDASLSDSKGESFIFPAISLQADETSTAGILLNQDEGITDDEHTGIAETLSLSPEAKSLLDQPLHFKSNGDDPKIISPDSRTEKNENGQKEEEVGGEEMAPKSYKSLFLHEDELLKHHSIKSCSRSDHASSPDASTVSNDWSVESFKSHGTGSNSEYIKDRSVSEVAVSVPKLTVISLDSAHKVSCLVKQFSLQNEESNDKITDAAPRRQSLPVDLSQATYFEANSFISLLHGKQKTLLFEESSSSYTSKECVSGKIVYFNRQDKEENFCDKGPRELPKKLGHMSPRVKASLEKIGACLSRGSSIDKQIELEERQILKSKENLVFKEATKNIPKILTASQKENAPCHKTKLKKLLQKVNKEKAISLGKLEELGDVTLSLSECSTCTSSLVNSKQITSENKCTAKESSHTKEITKVAAEDACDTEEEVEDMPVEPEQNIALYSKENDVCLSEDRFSVVNSSRSFNEHSSPEQSKSSKISCVSDGEAGGDSFHNSFSGTTKKKILGILDMNSDGYREVVCKKSLNFFSTENLCQSTDGSMQAAVSSQLDTCDGRQSNIAAKADGSKVDTNCESRSSKLIEMNISDESECLSQDDFPKSLENESCDELINLDIDHSGDEVFGDDFSDASEFVIELVSKSPISAITERTEESGQENGNLNSRQERVSDLCSENGNDSLKQTVDNSNLGSTCQSVEQKMVNGSAIVPISEKHFPSLTLNIVNDSSHFTGTSVQGDSLVQTQTSLLSRIEPVDPHSSQCSASVVGQYSSKPGTKAKLPMLNNNFKEDKIEKSATPPSSPTIKTLYGPLRTTLHRNSSKSMHNLASNHGSVYKSQGLHNRALSLSNDNLESNSLRAKSLSPGPVPRQKMKCSPESERQGNLNRRCISAVALNENEGHVNLKRNRSFSLTKLNRSRSSSLTSISSSKKLDYTQIPSKVRQYIKDMKDKDIRNSTRSLPSTPARKKHQQTTSQIVVLNEKLLMELSQFDDNDIADDIRKIRDQIIGEKGDPKRLEDILKLLILERKSRHASDTTLAALQLRFDNLNALFAEKQNEIDRLRFYKDIQVNKEYIFSIQTQEERIVTSGRSSHNTTAPNTPMRSTHHYLTSPNMTRRSSSYQTTPPNTPNIRSLSPTLSHSNLIKTTSTPIADPNWGFAYDPNSSCVFQESLPGDTSRVQHSMVAGEDRSRDLKNQEINWKQERSRDLEDQAMSKDIEIMDSSHDGVSLQLWMKDARTVLKRIKEFALLEGSDALQQSESSIIWNSILQQYWHLSYRFPVLTLLASSNEPGILLQELGQALQATAHRFDLKIVAGRYQEGGKLDESNLKKISCGDNGKGKESHVKSLSDGYRRLSLDGSGKYGSPKSVGEVIEQVCCELNNVSQNTLNNNKTTSDPSCRVDGLGEEGSHNAVRCSLKKLEERQLGLEKDVTNIQEIKENLILENDKRIDIGEASSLSGNIPTEAYQHDCNQTEFKKGTAPVPELSTAVMGGQSGSVPVKEKEETGAAAVCSPAHSRESLKTVGPLEKVKLWQASLLDPEVPHAAYESSNISPAPSILSLNSSQSFGPHVDPSNSLTNLHVDSTQSPNRSGANLSLDHSATGNSRSVRNKIINYPPKGQNIDCNSPLRSPDRLEFDLPKCSWRSTIATPRLPWGRTVKARDLDSGCPGSEQSTRMSHNASLEQPEQLEMPNFHSSLDATSNVKVSSATLVEPSRFHELGNEKHEDDYVFEDVSVNKSLSRSSSHSHGYDNISRDTAEASPPSDVVKMAFPEFEKCEINNVIGIDVNRKSRTLSASRSSINSSKKRIDQHYSRSESQDAIKKYGHGRPVSANFNVRDDYYRREKSRNSDSKENTANEGVVRSRGRDFISDVPCAHQRMKPRKTNEKKTLVGRERSKGFQNDHKISACVEKGQNKNSNILSTHDKAFLKDKNTKKYSAKYVSGNSSDYSDTSVSSQNSSNIYNNITKLKRDLNIIKLQMMNLTSEGFQKKRGGGERVHACSNNQSSILERRQKPIKALDMSVYSEDSEQDSSITSVGPCYVHRSLRDQKPSSSKPKATAPTKIKSQNSLKEDFHKQPRSHPLDWNVKDSQQDTSLSFSNSSLEPLSESMFAISKIEKLAKSTPKNKKCQSKDRANKMSPCLVDSRPVNEAKDKKCGESVKINLFVEDHVKTTDVQEHLRDENQSMERLPSVHNCTKHASVQTEKNNVSLISELVETTALTRGTSNKEVNTDGTRIKHQGKPLFQATDGQLLNTTAPVIYIQNYNCGNETSRAGSEAVDKFKSPERSGGRCKHRRSGSAQELMVSLDEATTLAERLRLRTESMLSYLNLHFSVHVDQIQS